MVKRLVAIIGGGFFLAACVTSEPGVNALGPSVSEIQALPVEEAKTHLADKTVMTFIDRHKRCDSPNANSLGYCEWVEGPGTQVEYFAEDGSWYLWSPGNKKLVSGKWILRLWRFDRYYVCVASSGAAINVLARYPQEDEFKCVQLAEYAGKITEAREADSFRLARDRIPFPLSGEPTTIDALLKQL